MDKNLLFALDIGTRSIVGMIGERTEDGVRVLAALRHEHTTRAMLDGQIHDVPEVAKVIRSVKAKLEKGLRPFGAGRHRRCRTGAVHAERRRRTGCSGQRAI